MVEVPLMDRDEIDGRMARMDSAVLRGRVVEKVLTGSAIAASALGISPRDRKMIDVVTRSLSNPDDVSRRQFDLYDHAGRTWMAKHAWWAAHNGYSVTTSAADVEEG